MLPICLQAHLLQGNKYDFYRESEKHRKRCKEELGKAEQMCWYIPDLEKGEHLKALITSCIASSLCPDVRLKITTVGLSLIGSLVCEAVEQYSDLRSHLIKAAYHSEMYDFYNRLSLNYSNNLPIKEDEGSRAFLEAIDRLTLCEMMVKSLSDEDRWSRRAILEELNYQKKILFQQLDNPTWKLTVNLPEMGMTLYENIHEIIADLEDEELQLSIHDYISDMVYLLEKASQYWSTHKL